jgi:dCMP deaminase
MERPSWTEYFKTLTSHASLRSPCSRLKVGCTIVRDNRIISQGYNGFISNAPHVSIVRDGHEVATIHAELNAIIDAAKRGVSINDAIAFITHYPCLNCYKALCAAGIKHVYYIDDYNNDILILDFIKFTNVKIEKI